MVEPAKPLRLHNERSPQFLRWIDGMTARLKERLPFDGPMDTYLTLGSGLDTSIKALNLFDSVEIPFSEIGLPEGANAAHPKKIVAGFSLGGKKIAVATGRTSAMEVPLSGAMTDDGPLEQMEVANAALSVVENIGAENVVQTTAAGGFNHPMFPFGKKPFNHERLPIVGVIGADLTWNYPMEHMGHYMANQGHFFALQNGSRFLNQAFISSMAETSPGTKVPVLYYSSIPAAFEDTGLAHHLITSNVQAVGMSYGPEKIHLSGANNLGAAGESKRIGRFMGVVIITDRVELQDQKNPKRRTPVSVLELRVRYPQDFEILEPSLDDEVRAMAAKANDKLGKALAHMIERI